jgi:hypothetical protein
LCYNQGDHKFLFHGGNRGAYAGVVEDKNVLGIRRHVHGISDLARTFDSVNRDVLLSTLFSKGVIYPKTGREGP